jgi:hypothetical protein
MTESMPETRQEQPSTPPVAKRRPPPSRTRQADLRYAGGLLLLAIGGALAFLLGLGTGYLLFSDMAMTQWCRGQDFVQSCYDIIRNGGTLPCFTMLSMPVLWVFALCVGSLKRPSYTVRMMITAIVSFILGLLLYWPMQSWVWLPEM